jgi:dihydroorotase
MLIAVHCEDEATIKSNLENIKQSLVTYLLLHHLIRSEEACYISSSKAVALAKKKQARLHVFHLSTAKEMSLFTNKTLKRRKLLPKFAFIIYGLPMRLCN